MIVRICLLISDDPDDYVELSEALYEVTADVVLVAVADLKKAAELLAVTKCTPEYIFLNLSMTGADNMLFFNALSRKELANTKVFAWGDARDLSDAARHRVFAFLDLNVSYVELKELLKNILANV